MWYRQINTKHQNRSKKKSDVKEMKKTPLELSQKQELDKGINTTTANKERQESNRIQTKCDIDFTIKEEFCHVSSIMDELERSCQRDSSNLVESVVSDITQMNSATEGFHEGQHRRWGWHRCYFRWNWSFAHSHAGSPNQRTSEPKCGLWHGEKANHRSPEACARTAHRHQCHADYCNVFHICATKWSIDLWPLSHPCSCGVDPVLSSGVSFRINSALPFDACGWEPSLWCICMMANWLKQFAANDAN